MAAADHDIDEQLLEKVHGLNDLELAALLSLIAREHCLISTSPEAVDELTEELRLIAAKTFGLSSAVVNCHAHTTLDDFAAALLLVPSPQASSGGLSSANNNNPGGRSGSPFRPRHQPLHHHDASSTGSYFLFKPGTAFRGPLSPSSPTAGVSQPLIANVILAKHLDRAPRAVQIQALELLRTRRIFTRTSVQTAPKQFLFIPVLGANSGGRAHVTAHLNDFFYLAHWHDPSDGFDFLDDEFRNDHRAPSSLGDISDSDSAASTASGTSIIKRGPSSILASSSAPAGRFSFSHSTHAPEPLSPQQNRNPQPPLLSETEIALFAQLSRLVRIDVSVTRYQMNIISFLRTHRAVDSGITPQATKHFEQLVRSLAPLHGLDFATPSLVALAAKKIYLHRIKIVTPDRERSMQWGSELGAVGGVLEGVGAEEVIEDVLSLVGVPC